MAKSSKIGKAMSGKGIGMREQGGGGPSVMSLYNAHTDNTNLGVKKGIEIENVKENLQEKYSLPIGGTDMSRSDFPGGRDAPPEWYNMRGMQPAKYDLPSHAKERLMAKQGVREAIEESSGGSVVRTEPITDAEVDMTMHMKRQADLADFDRYVQTLIDPLKPGNLKWLMEVYPDFVYRRVAQVHDDYDFAIRSQMIENWGINSIDDLYFKYMQDQGKISGGKLSKRIPLATMYRVGAMAPKRNRQLAGQTHFEDGAVRLPYASSLVEDSNDWNMPKDGQPFAKGSRDYKGLAKYLNESKPIKERGWAGFGSGRTAGGMRV